MICRASTWRWEPLTKNGGYKGRRGDRRGRRARRRSPIFSDGYLDELGANEPDGPGEFDDFDDG